jgi:hypothetical protein
MKLITFDGNPYYTVTIAELNVGRLVRKERFATLRFDRAMQVVSVYLATFGTSRRDIIHVKSRAL